MTLKSEILELKERLNAVILAHNYQTGDIQDVADFVGDSLGLAQQASTTKADIIVFCGVHFMAETAKILNPTKIVVLPDMAAGCSLEESCPADKLKELQATNPNFYTIAYINCSAEVKALSDLICTSGNAVKMVESAPKDRDILFVPDENLGEWVMEQTHIPMTLWKGNCYVHNDYTTANILRLKQKYVNADVIVHPESPAGVRKLASVVCSTERMFNWVKHCSYLEHIIVTESGVIHRLQKEFPDHKFICVPTYDVMRMPTDKCKCNECKFMKMNTLEKVRDCMKYLNPRIEMTAELLCQARLPMEKMLELSK